MKPFRQQASPMIIVIVLLNLLFKASFIIRLSIGILSGLHPMDANASDADVIIRLSRIRNSFIVVPSWPSGIEMTHIDK